MATTSCQAQAKFASPWALLANFVLRGWPAYLPAPVTVFMSRDSTYTSDGVILCYVRMLQQPVQFAYIYKGFACVLLILTNL